MGHIVILIIFLASFGISASTKVNCDLQAAVGIRLTIQFDFEKLATTEKLVWSHNYTVIYQQDKGKVSVGKPDDITSSGSLVLKNPRLTSAGLYQAKVSNASGAVIKTWSTFVCVMDKVPKPTLTYACDQKSVKFSCNTVKSHDLRYSWTMDAKVLSGETTPVLMIPLNKLNSKNSFICGVSNLVSNEISDTVRPVCVSQPSSIQNQLCYPPKTVLAVLSGAVGLVIILVTVIIALCCCLRRLKQPKRREKVEAATMLSLTRREPETDYETMHYVPEMSLDPSPQPSPRATYSADKSSSDSLQPPRPTEGLDPSPVPKPRTKRPNTPDL